MLFLFNSAGDKGYTTNVLNTLHLPNGAANVYQYSINTNNDFEKNSYVETTLAKRCLQKPIEKSLNMLRY